MASFTDQDFKSFVQRVLNKEYLVELVEGVRLSINDEIDVFDLTDRDGNYYVEIKSTPVNKSNILNSIERLQLALKSRLKSSFKIILVYNFDIPDTDKVFFSNNLGEISSHVKVYDLSDIISLAKKHSIDIKDFGFQKKGNPFDNLNNHAKLYISNVLKSKNLYFGKHVWNNKDQSDRFKADRVWENINDINELRIVNSVEKGDIVFLKSSNISDDINYLIIEGFGVVTRNFKNGQSLEVNWFLFNGSVKVDGLGKYRGVFQAIMPADRELVLTRLAQEIPSFLDDLDKFENESITRLKVENEIAIDENAKIVFGQEVGPEIASYSIFFLPQSLSGSVDGNGIGKKVLNVLGIKWENIRLNIEELKSNQYKWLNFENSLGDQRYHICFVVSTDEEENYLDFTENLEVAITGFEGLFTSDVFGGFENRIFIPLLETDGNGMSIDHSFKNVLGNILSFQNIFLGPKLIRINFPLDISDYKIKNYGRDLLSELGLKSNSSFIQDDLEVNKTKDKIPFHLDNVETIDKLNRAPVAKSLARLINKDIFDQDGMNHSFMVHLQGEWGSGKSTFLNLIKSYLNTDNRKWIVIEYNAWQNQHISPPWWTFLNQVFIQGKAQVERWDKPRIIVGEKLRRIIWYSGWNKIFSFIITLVLLLIILLNFATIFNSVTTIANLDSTFNTADFVKLMLSLGSVVALIFSFSKLLATPFTLKSSKQAEAFTSRASDPMNQIKNHFNHLIADFNSVNFDVAIFIDDIDRCNGRYTIELLEGVQTLFKDRKVLYIVAGDTKWITSCFENNYKEFSSTSKSQGQNLGELFLEKAFQLSVRMPDVSEESKEAYWKEIIGATSKTETEQKLAEDGITPEIREEIKLRLVNNYNQNENNSRERSKIEKEFNITGKQVADLAIEGLDENVEDVRHLLLSFHSLISPNPRSIKRLANNYSMYRNTLIAEDTDFKPGHLFRWLLLEDKYPSMVKYFLENKEVISLTGYIESKEDFTEKQVADLKEIIYGREEMNEEELQIVELNQILRK